MSVTPFYTWCIDAYARLVAIAMPVVFVIGFCNVGINIIINAAFHGKLKIGGRS